VKKKFFSIKILYNIFMKHLDTSKMFRLLFVVSLIFIIAMLISIMSGWSFTVRIGVFALAIAISLLYILYEIGRERWKRTAEPEAVFKSAEEDDLLSAANVMITNRLKEIDSAVWRGEEGLEGMSENEARLRQAREFSLASAIAGSPELVLDRDSIIKLALNRAWRILHLELGAALEWTDSAAGRARVAAVEGKVDEIKNIGEIYLDELGVQTLKSAALADWSKDEKFEGLLRGAKTKIGVPVQIGDYRWGWILLESRERKSLSATETRFLVALGRELSAALSILDDWKNARDEMKSVLARLSDHIAERRSKKKGRGERIGKLYESAANVLGMGSMEIEIGRFAAIVMDLGEVGVPELILNKAGDLTPQEMRFVKDHPALSVKLLREFVLTKYIEQTVVAHHETWIGDGYPSGIKGEEIPRTARLLSACDTVEALLSDRPYRNAYDSAETINEIKKLSGNKFDPEIISAIEKVYEPWINWMTAK